MNFFLKKWRNGGGCKPPSTPSPPYQCKMHWNFSGKMRCYKCIIIMYRRQSVFCRIKATDREGYCYSPRLLVHSKVPPCIFVRCPRPFAGTHLYSWVERGTVRVKCPAQEHDAIIPARAGTQAALSEVHLAFLADNYVAVNLTRRY